VESARIEVHDQRRGHVWADREDVFPVAGKGHHRPGNGLDLLQVDLPAFVQRKANPADVGRVMESRHGLPAGDFSARRVDLLEHLDRRNPIALPPAEVDAAARQVAARQQAAVGPRNDGQVGGHLRLSARGTMIHQKQHGEPLLIHIEDRPSVAGEMGVRARCGGQRQDRCQVDRPGHLAMSAGNPVVDRTVVDRSPIGRVARKMAELIRLANDPLALAGQSVRFEHVAPAIVTGHQAVGGQVVHQDLVDVVGHQIAMIRRDPGQPRQPFGLHSHQPLREGGPRDRWQNRTESKQAQKCASVHAQCLPFTGRLLPRTTLHSAYPGRKPKGSSNHHSTAPGDLSEFRPPLVNLFRRFGV